MLVRLIIAVSLGCITLLSTLPVRPASGQGLNAFCHSLCRDWKRNNCWPTPFVYPDRQTVRAPFAVMVHKGWERQNTLGEYHFDPQQAQLNEAGRLKVRRILTQVVPQHRTIYVLRTDSPEGTAARVDAVRQLAHRILPEDQVPPVLTSNVQAAGWPASQVDEIGRKFQSSTPDPRLPKMVTDAGSAQ